MALHHSTIHVLVARVVFLEDAFSFISEISSSETMGKLGENELGLLPLFVCFVEQKEDFHWRKYCAVVFQSSGCLPPFCSCCEAINGVMKG